MNVAALHLLKNRDAKSRAEFFKLDDTRRMGESGQELGGCRSEDTWWCNTCWLATPLATVLSEVSRAVSTAGTAAGIAGLEPGTGALLITGVAVPGPNGVEHSLDSNWTFCTLACPSFPFR